MTALISFAVVLAFSALLLRAFLPRIVGKVLSAQCRTPIAVKSLVFRRIRPALLEITLKDVSLANVAPFPTSETMIAIPQIDLDLETGPLLLGRLHFRNVSVESPSVTLRFAFTEFCNISVLYRVLALVPRPSPMPSSKIRATQIRILDSNLFVAKSSGEICSHRKNAESGEILVADVSARSVRDLVGKIAERLYLGSKVMQETTLNVRNEHDVLRAVKNRFDGEIKTCFDFFSDFDRAV